jgi:hypothetical protein
VTGPHLGEFLDRWRATNRPAPDVSSRAPAAGTSNYSPLSSVEVSCAWSGGLLLSAWVAREVVV